MSTGMALALLLAGAPPAQAADQVIGLLTVPEVFGRGACDEFQPSDLRLYPSPDADQVIGWIRVDRYRTFHAAGGCEGLLVNVHHAGSGRVRELPTREYEYEAPALIVLQQRDRWFRVRLDGGAAWIRASERNEFLPLERLLTDRLTYFTGASDGRLSASPGGRAREVERDPPSISGDHSSVRVVESRRVGDQLWLHVETLSHSVCESPEEPKVAVRGWIPAHGPSGEPTIWFSSRGC